MQQSYWWQGQIQLPAKPRGFHLITELIARAIPQLAQLEMGVVHS